MPQPFEKKRRITQQDIANQAGVSRSTVTYALKDHPRIPLQTRKRIKEIAEQIGYTPDPMLSSLAYYRSHKCNATYRGLLAWLVYEHYQWRDSPHYLRYFNGAHRQATSHGYQLEEFKLEPSRAKMTRTASILRARGINGILLSPLPSSDTQLEFPWELFSAVAIGYTLKHPRLHSVASAHFNNVTQAATQLTRKGYRRIGLAVDRETNIRCGNTVASAFIGEQMQRGVSPAEIIPPFFEVYNTRPHKADIDRLVNYIRTSRLDAIITEDNNILKRLKGTSLRVPEDIAVAGLNMPHADQQLAGVVETSESIGAHAIDLIAAMIQRGERGAPQTPVRSHVEGVWTDGYSAPLCR